MIVKGNKLFRVNGLGNEASQCDCVRERNRTINNYNAQTPTNFIAFG